MSTSSAQGAQGAPVLAAAGDIACDPASPYFNGGAGIGSNCRQLATSRLLRGADTVVPLGDLQYEHASLRNFRKSYDRSWGRYLRVTRPVIGNHEYGPPQSPNMGAGGYWRYFGEERAGSRGEGWYSFDIGAWHAIALNSQCLDSHEPENMQRMVGCDRGSSQFDWLERDLAENPRECIVASWHHPRFSSGSGGPWRETSPFWRRLQAAGADIVLSGHDHSYERFNKQLANGSRASAGIRQFVVGTGGKSIGKPFNPVRPSSQARERAPGVLRLRLKAQSYSWKFVRAGDRKVLDRGSASC